MRLGQGKKLSSASEVASAHLSHCESALRWLLAPYPPGHHRSSGSGLENGEQVVGFYDQVVGSIDAKLSARIAGV